MAQLWLYGSVVKLSSYTWDKPLVNILNHMSWSLVTRRIDSKCKPECTKVTKKCGEQLLV